MRLAALFSGGKDSSYCIRLAQLAGHEVVRLVTAYAPEASYMYHVPAIILSELAAEALGIEQVRFEVNLDDELSPLEGALSQIDVEGVLAGAVASEYQRSRIDGICENLGLDLVALLWHRDPTILLREMLGDGFEIMIVGVAADGLGEGWLGEILGPSNLDRFLDLCQRFRIHPCGEGGEYESFVLSGPHMRGRIVPKFKKIWNGVSGELEIEGAELIPWP